MRRARGRPLAGPPAIRLAPPTTLRDWALIPYATDASRPAGPIVPVAQATVTPNDAFRQHLVSCTTALLSYALSDSTKRKHDTQRKKLEEFLAQLGDVAWPPTTETCMLYIAFLATVAKKGAPFAWSSVVAYAGFITTSLALSHPHIASPMHHPMVRRLLTGVGKVLGKAPTKARPCSVRHLMRLRATVLGNPTRRNVMLMFLSSLALFGALRINNVIPTSTQAHLTRRQLLFDAAVEADVPNPKALWLPLRLSDVTERPGELYFSLRRSKTDTAGDNHHSILIVPLGGVLEPVCPYRWFHSWRAAVSPRDNSFLAYYGPSPADYFTREVFIRAFRSAVGNEAADVRIAQEHVRSELTAHSFRRGFMLLCVMLRVPLHLAMLHGKWASMDSALGYAASVIQPCPIAAALSNPMAIRALEEEIGRL